MNKFGEKVYKAVIDAGFTCPNIDGKCGYGGCAYCYDGAGEFTHGSALTITEQLRKERERILKKSGAPKLIAYFQAHTNTYAPIEVLREKYSEALDFPGVVGLSIATRADCIDEDVAALLSEFSEKTYLTVELGLQTIHDETAKRINRCHSFEQFLKGYKMLYSRGIRTCVHLINSLPGETPEMMIDTAKVLGELQPGGVKIHMLNILDGTAMANEYVLSPFPMLTREEYVDVVVRQLEYFHENTVIERLTGDGIKNRIIAPNWVKDKLKTLVEIDKRQVLLNSYQGKAYQ